MHELWLWRVNNITVATQYLVRLSWQGDNCKLFMTALISGSDLDEIIIMGDFQLQARLKCCCKHSRNLHGATHTILEYALLSVQAVYAQLLLFFVNVWHHRILIVSTWNVGQMRVRSQSHPDYYSGQCQLGQYSTTLTHVVKLLSMYQAPSLCHLTRYTICIVMETFSL